MKAKQYIQQKRQYITPSIRIVQIELEGVMGAATAEGTGEGFTPGDGHGGNEQSKRFTPIIFDNNEE